MSANKNVRVCVITSPGLLVEVDADRADRKATASAPAAVRTSYVRRRSGAGSDRRCPDIRHRAAMAAIRTGVTGAGPSPAMQAVVPSGATAMARGIPAAGIAFPAAPAAV